ncbi:hypothetical protein HanXRQr2_Chr07g0297901 [Helianthus annuus]|uniref:Nucleotide-binding alpha-beta plait domain-containing protein n=1 Tax=Helianthus annuus TaxID=4232 RepID=A0A9K3NGJ9_HELAN|nr:hypothetical protein HanXRQr2_Chr07g0297901 [Helianthus annuus]KAJ0550406.1 hypothetical protein HanHA300_Chr07g0245011 [Helianthus annuus]KAJ0563361.1 hypothetical protein HanHA89_Chr07g0262201 [Helianthus annuus]KAJ0731457.1 hypothetical protein HanOQP8_Chr07g0252151 [Helianthus annuus]KAJ0904960.1 hypothetical protein HanPSC8_Chr07g0288391 [Helianthus annuus]
MGNSKLIVNIARFAVENAGLFDNSFAQKKDIPAAPPVENRAKEQVRNQAFIKDGGGRLFSDLFRNGGQEKRGSSSKLHQEGSVVEVHDSILAFQEIVGLAAVGKCKNLKILNNLSSLVSKAGGGEFSLSYLGGLSVLFKFASEENCNKFVCNHLLWQDWLSSLDHWNGQSLPFERIAWLRVIGVPIHLAADKVFDSIARKFGKVIHGSQRSPEDVDLSSNCIGVLRGDGVRIAEEISLIWKDKRFIVWVEEEMAEWIPDGFGEEDLGEEEVDSSEDIRKSSEFHFDDSEAQKVAKNVQEPAKSFNDPLVEMHGDPSLHGEVSTRSGECNNCSYNNGTNLGGIPEVFPDAQNPFNDGGVVPPGPTLGNSKKVKKKPFNLFKDKHLRKPILVSPASNTTGPSRDLDWRQRSPSSFRGPKG